MPAKRQPTRIIRSRPKPRQPEWDPAPLRRSQITRIDRDGRHLAGVLRWQNLRCQPELQGKADDPDIPITGPTQPPGLTFSYHFKSSTEISYVMKINGRPDAYGIDTLNANDHSWTDISWSPGKEKEKSTSVYVRQ